MPYRVAVRLISGDSFISFRGIPYVFSVFVNSITPSNSGMITAGDEVFNLCGRDFNY